MPLFKVVVKSTVEIPVHAETAEEAYEYANSTREWMEDGAFHIDKNYAVFEAKKIETPAESIWDSKTLCWNDDSMTIDVGQAFFESENPFPPEDENGNYNADAVEEWSVRQGILEEQFDADRNLLK